MSVFSMPLDVDAYKKVFGLNFEEIKIGYDFCNELKEKNIPYFKCITHPEVLGCLESELYYSQFDNLIGKNYSICKHLFVHERKGLKRKFLIVVDSEKDVNLQKLREDFDLGKLEFCSNEELKESLNTIPGNVSLFHTKFDKNKQVNIIMDSELLEKELLAFHPLYNGMSLFITPTSVIDYLKLIDRNFITYSVTSKNDYTVLAKTL